MKLWDVSGDGRPWSVELDVRDLGGHLDFTRRARAGTLSRRVKEATHAVAAVGALPLGFKVKLGLVMLLKHRMSLPPPLALPGQLLRGQFGPVECPLLTPLLCLISWMVRLELTCFYTIWTRFPMMRRYLAHWPVEVPRIFRMLDLIAHVLASLGLPGTGRSRAGFVRPSLFLGAFEANPAFSECYY